MTHQGVNELAVRLWRAIERVRHLGGRVVPSNDHTPPADCCCPLGALLGYPAAPSKIPNYPHPSSALLASVGVPRDIAVAFMCGFDARNHHSHSDDRLYDLGRTFRDECVAFDDARAGA